MNNLAKLNAKKAAAANALNTKTGVSKPSTNLV